MKGTVKKLQHVKNYKEEYLDFLKHFKWDFGVDDLLPLGARQWASTVSLLPKGFWRIVFKVVRGRGRCLWQVRAYPDEG
jgi:hypothetical protein